MDAKEKAPVKSIDQSILVKHDILRNFYAPHHYHEDYEIIYVKKSQGLRVIGNKVDNYKPGEVLIIGPRLPHYHELSVTDKTDEYPIENIAVLFPESIFELNNQYPEFSKTKLLIDQLKYGIELKGKTRLKAQNILENMTLKPSYKNFVSLFKLIEILVEEDSNYSTLSTVKYENMRLYNEKTKHVLDFISKHFQENISVGTVADKATMSTSSFCVFFKSQTGYTYSQYLNLLRVSKASELLVTTQKGIAEIAYEVGFENLAYFNRRFKEIKKCTPKEFRNKLVS